MAKLLIINPGSTSTKIGVFEDEELLFEETLRHTTEEIAQYATIVDQKDFRKKIIMDFIASKGVKVEELAAVVGRGGMLKPIPGGTYPVSDDLLEDLKIGKQGQHASNLGGILAREIADSVNIPSFIVDPVVVDELQPLARYSGVPELPRTSVFHALNQKAVAKRYAKEIGRDYKDLNLIVVHMGGGVSVGAHKNGRIIDVFNALDGDGAFSPERAGAVPPGALVKLCFSGKYDEKTIYKMLVGNGGFNAYLGTNDARVVEEKIKEGDKKAEEVYNAFIYQISKNIGAQAAVLEGKVDQIILTGGIAYGKTTCDAIKAKVGWIAPITVYPGEDELLALCQGGLRVTLGEEKAMEY
jgi:butyrate kinase